ncbi:uncharacterized protein LOC130695021 [Daphnia carinata]|uniref:uncharacterized protein LOC130695021 n=1 Tax=Daphnia carinata TaxID=120202 RepID=UPI00257B817A|nr:uncharacterized protein LOC130695021 [Daphnia carinata]
MERISKLTVLAVVLALSSCCHAESTVSYRPVRVYADVEVALPCWELVNAGHLILWITPAEVVIGPDHDASEKYAIDFEGSLIVNDTEKSDTGVYKCISKSPDGAYTTTKTELEVIDASYLPEVDEWQKNLARGLIAAAATAAFFIAACGFSYFSWDERHAEGKSNRSPISSASHPLSATSSDTPNVHELKGLDNPALAIDTNEVDSGL